MLSTREGRQLQREICALIDKLTRQDDRTDGSDPIVRMMPNTWVGADFRGRKFSECDPGFLDATAVLLDALAAQNDARNRHHFAARDRELAATARRWRDTIAARASE